MSSDVAQIVDQIIEAQVRRRFYISLINKQTNAAGALVRRALGWRYDTEEAARSKINKRAGAIVAAAMAGKAQKTDDAAVVAIVSVDLLKVALAIAPLAEARHEIELEMVRLARRLPVAPWAKSVRGLGEKALAVIVGEAGDLGAYAPDRCGKAGKLRKRLGLAPYNGHAYSQWRSKGGLTAEEWTDAGYKPARRAEMYAVVAEPLFKHQTMIGGPYRAIYDQRRAHTAVTHPEWSKGHSHDDALRIMTQRLISDLWSEWRRATPEVPFEARAVVPAADAPSGDEPERRASQETSARTSRTSSGAPLSGGAL